MTWSLLLSARRFPIDMKSSCVNTYDNAIALPPISVYNLVHKLTNRPFVQGEIMAVLTRYDAALTVDSKLTSRSQTTIPSSVREALQLQPGKDHLQYEILPGGKVLLSRQEKGQEDEVMSAFLQFLASDIKTAPQRVQPLDMSRGRELVAGLAINIDDEICDEDE